MPNNAQNSHNSSDVADLSSVCRRDSDLEAPAHLLSAHGTGYPLVLAYHHLSEGIPQYRYDLSTADFENHLQMFAAVASGGLVTSAHPVVTFDDGYECNHSLALPLLEEHNVKGTFFLIVGRIERHPKSMTWRHVNELVSLGHEVGAHSWSHPFLTQCTEAQLRKELLYAKDTLEDELGTAVTSLSVPHGRFNNRVLDACAEYGYRNIYTSDFWCDVRVRSGITIAGRLMVHSKMRSDSIRRLLTMTRLRLHCESGRYRIKRFLRRAIGDQLYHHLWIQVSGWTGSSTDIGVEESR